MVTSSVIPCESSCLLQGNTMQKSLRKLMSTVNNITTHPESTFYIDYSCCDETRDRFLSQYLSIQDSNSTLPPITLPILLSISPRIGVIQISNINGEFVSPHIRHPLSSQVSIPSHLELFCSKISGPRYPSPLLFSCLNTSSYLTFWKPTLTP